MDVLRMPIEVALTCGADNRSLSRLSELNLYGTSAKPIDAVPFGSCTSSSTSARGFEAARRLQHVLRNTNSPDAAADSFFNTIRRRLRHTLRIPADSDIVFTPSGTDVELIAAAIAGNETNRTIVNIVVGPNEVGSGTPLAAAGCHYDSLVPSGQTVAVGDPVNEEFASRIVLELVPLRHDDGTMVEPAELDERVKTLVSAAVSNNAIPLLHLVAHSKTGVHAPSLECVHELQGKYKELVVMVDGAQGRFSRTGMAASIAREHLFMITGSKFFGGPPFSGALIVPRKYAQRALRSSGLPEGFGNYFTAVGMPQRWRAIRCGLPKEPNFGALLRWSAALAEIEAYYATPSDLRFRVLRHFEQQVPIAFRQSTVCKLLVMPPSLFGEERLLQSNTTVFNFAVTRASGEQLDMLSLRHLHAQLNSDLSSSGDRSSSLLRRRFHLGQPVRIGKAKAALRVALGGELIVRVATDRRLGATMDGRLAWLGEQLRMLQEKTDLIVSSGIETVQLATS